MKFENIDQRKALAGSKRIVVKVGSRVLVDKEGRPELARIRSLVKQIGKLH